MLHSLDFVTRATVVAASWTKYGYGPRCIYKTFGRQSQTRCIYMYIYIWVRVAGPPRRARVRPSAPLCFGWGAGCVNMMHMHECACICVHVHAYACMCMHLHAYSPSQPPTKSTGMQDTRTLAGRGGEQPAFIYERCWLIIAFGGRTQSRNSFPKQALA